eukprot:g2586.t1
MATAGTISFGPHLVRKTSIFFESKLSYGLVNLKPILPGHVLLIPKRVVPRFRDLTENEVADLYRSVQIVSNVVETAFKAEGLNIAQQDGAAAGQSVPHVHVHILPRKGTALDFGEGAGPDEVHERIQNVGLDKDLAAQDGSGESQVLTAAVTSFGFEQLFGTNSWLHGLVDRRMINRCVNKVLATVARVTTETSTGTACGADEAAGGGGASASEHGKRRRVADAQQTQQHKIADSASQHVKIDLTAIQPILQRELARAGQLLFESPRCQSLFGGNASAAPDKKKDGSSMCGVDHLQQLLLELAQWPDADPEARRTARCGLCTFARSAGYEGSPGVQQLLGRALDVAMAEALVQLMQDEKSAPGADGVKQLICSVTFLTQLLQTVPATRLPAERFFLLGECVMPQVLLAHRGETTEETDVASACAALIRTMVLRFGKVGAGWALHNVLTPILDQTEAGEAAASLLQVVLQEHTALFLDKAVLKRCAACLLRQLELWEEEAGAVGSAAENELRRGLVAQLHFFSALQNVYVMGLFDRSVLARVHVTLLQLVFQNATLDDEVATSALSVFESGMKNLKHLLPCYLGVLNYCAANHVGLQVRRAAVQMRAKLAAEAARVGGGIVDEAGEASYLEALLQELREAVEVERDDKGEASDGIVDEEMDGLNLHNVDEGGVVTGSGRRRPQVVPAQTEEHGVQAELLREAAETHDQGMQTDAADVQGRGMQTDAREVCEAEVQASVAVANSLVGKSPVAVVDAGTGEDVVMQEAADRETQAGSGASPRSAGRGGDTSQAVQDQALQATSSSSPVVQDAEKKAVRMETTQVPQAEQAQMLVEDELARNEAENEKQEQYEQARMSDGDADVPTPQKAVEESRAPNSAEKKGSAENFGGSAGKEPEVPTPDQAQTVADRGGAEKETQSAAPSEGDDGANQHDASGKGASSPAIAGEGGVLGEQSVAEGKLGHIQQTQDVLDDAISEPQAKLAAAPPSAEKAQQSEPARTSPVGEEQEESADVRAVSSAPAAGASDSRSAAKDGAEVQPSSTQVVPEEESSSASSGPSACSAPAASSAPVTEDGPGVSLEPRSVVQGAVSKAASVAAAASSQVGSSCMSPDSISSPRAQAFAMLRTIRGDDIAELPLGEDLDVGDLRKRAAQFMQGSWQHILLFFGTENVTQQQTLRVDDPDASVYATNHPEKSKWLRAFEKLRENSEETYLFYSTEGISIETDEIGNEIGVHNLLFVAPDEISMDETICAAALRAAATRRHWRAVAWRKINDIVGHAYKLERDSTTAYLAAIVELFGVSIFDWERMPPPGFRVRDFPTHVRSIPSCRELARAALAIPLTIWDNGAWDRFGGIEGPVVQEDRQPGCLELAMDEYMCGNLLRDRDFILSVAARGGDAFCLLLGYGFRPPVDFPPSAAAARTDFLPHQEQAATMFQAFRNDKEVVTALVELGGVFMLAHAADEIRGDFEVVAAAVGARRVSTGGRDFSAARKGAAMGLMFATEALRGDRGVVEKLARLNGFALVAASRELQEDIELAAIAIAQAAGVFAHLPDLIRCRQELALLAVSREGAQLEFVFDPGEAVARAAIENDARKAFPLVPEDCGYRADLDPKLKRLTISAILRTCAKHPDFQYRRSRKAKRINSAAGVLSRIPECDRDHFLSALGVESCELVASILHYMVRSGYIPTWLFCDAEIITKVCGLDWFGTMAPRILSQGSGWSEALRDSADLVAAGVRGSGTANEEIDSLIRYSQCVVYHVQFFVGAGGSDTRSDQFLEWRDSLVNRSTFKNTGLFSEVNDFEDMHWDVEDFAGEDQRSGGRLRSLAHLAVERGCNPQSRCLPASLRNDPTFKKVWEIYLRRWCGFRVIIDLGGKTDPKSAYAPTADKILDQFEDHTEQPVATFEEYLQLLDSAGLRAPDVWGADN